VPEEKAERKKLDPRRRAMPKQQPWERVKNFDEVALGYPIPTAVEEAGRCLQCKKPACNQGCPVGIDIPGFIKCIVEGDYGAGVRKIKATNAAPSSNSRAGRPRPTASRLPSPMPARNAARMVVKA